MGPSIEEQRKNIRTASVCLKNIAKNNHYRNNKNSHNKNNHKCKNKTGSYFERKFKISKLRNRSYFYFLNSNYWKWIRKEILRRDSYKCILCGKTNNLQVHHTTYEHHFEEHNHLRDLDTLCGNCHYITHAGIPKNEYIF